MEAIWWAHITRARHFMEDVVRTLCEGSSMVLIVPEPFPWRETFMEMTEEELAVSGLGRRVDVISCPEEDPGEFLLNEYCGREKRAEYRYGVSYARFLGKSRDTVLGSRIIWLKGVTGKYYGEWLDFIEDYIKEAQGCPSAIFVLEMTDAELASKKGKKGIRKLEFRQCINDYDRFAFCALAATETGCQDYLHPYLAELASDMCREDIELCAEAVREWNRFLKEPIGTLRWIEQTGHRNNGDSFRIALSDEELGKRIWETQLKTVFPAIEKYRSCLVIKYQNQIMAGLPIINSHNEKIDSPEDVEIGDLWSMVKYREIEVIEQDAAAIEQCRSARNKLAHLSTITFEEVAFLLKLY